VKTTKLDEEREVYLKLEKYMEEENF